MHELADLPPAVRLLPDVWLGSCGPWTSPWYEKISKAEFRCTMGNGAFLVLQFSISKFMTLRTAMYMILETIILSQYLNTFAIPKFLLRLLLKLQDVPIPGSLLHSQRKSP